MTAAWIFLGIGVLLIAIEAMVLSYFLMFFGAGFLLVGILIFFVEISLLWQLLLAFVISILLLLILRRPIKNYFNKSDNSLNPEFLNETGIGEVKEGMIYFKGTFWKADISDLNAGDKVKVLGVKNGQIIIEKNA